MATRDQILEALGRTKRTLLGNKAIEAEKARDLVLGEFPLSRWGQLGLDMYAMGGRAERPFCTVMEFHTDALGSIKGGSAAKHMIYRHRTGEWRLAPALQGLGPQEAWATLREEFLAAFDAARVESLDALDDTRVLWSGQALVAKTLATYFPQHFVPVYSRDHLLWFLQLLGQDPLRGARSWSLNYQLLLGVRDLAEEAGLEPGSVVHGLYLHFPPPRDAQVLKIAPGRGAEWWSWCLSRSVIGVGWNEVGDLAEYASKNELQESLDEQYGPSQYHSTLANYLLKLRDLQEGDRIVANRGEREILAVGTVTNGYRFQPDSNRLIPFHLVGVKWNTDYAQRLDQAAPGWRQTFGRVSPDLLRTIESRTASLLPLSVQVHDRKPVQLPDAVERLIAATNDKLQVILHGPPGTGKTRLALRAALALTGGYPAREENVTGAVNDALSNGERIMLTTFHPSYGYEDFIEGFKPVPSQNGGLNLELRHGLFHQACEAARTHPERPFVLIIDELNRGDIPRVFGELITMIEKDKRGMPIRLPVSGASFSVPANLRVIATLNSADHSVADFDLAIHRRFSMMRVDPDPDVLAGSVDALDLGDFLRELNARIDDAIGPDHQIGHAYLLRDDRPIEIADQLATVFYNELVPLLIHHSYAHRNLLPQLLGTLVDDDTGQVKSIPAPDLADALASEFTKADDA